MAIKKSNQRPLSQKRMMAVLYRRAGGLKKVSEKANVTQQLAVFWRRQGFVPLKHVARVAKELGVTPYAINYDGYTEFSGETIPWKKVVTSCLLTKEETKFILE